MAARNHHFELKLVRKSGHKCCHSTHRQVRNRSWSIESAEVTGSLSTRSCGREGAAMLLVPILVKYPVPSAKGMDSIVHFEIPADNPKRASKFYNDAFGWNIQQWESMP